MLLHIFALLLLIVAVAADTLAFEVWGVKSGMAQDEVLATLKRQGFTVYTQQLLTEPPNTNSFMADRGKESHSVGFCNGRLSFYSYKVTGGIRSFVRRVNDLTTKRGYGNYSVRSIETDNAGELNLLSFVWQEAHDSIKITYFAPSEGVAESISISHTTANQCHK